jgi:RND family efflux transporter MFP subunit
MKPWMKWTAIGLVAALLAAGAVRTLSARKAKQATLDAQQVAQKTQVVIELNTSDLVSAKTVPLSQGIGISGPLKAVNSVFVKARVAGELQGLSLREGDAVKAGQIIARIDATESQARVNQARQQAQAAKAQVDIAQRSFDNNKALVAQGFISSTALDSSQAALAGAQATLSAAQAGADLTLKSLDDTVLRAPIAGQISQRLAQMGERVPVDARIVEIVDNSRLELEATLNAADSLQVKVGQIAQLHIEGLAQSITAKVARINPSATVGSRAVQVYLSLTSVQSLRQGLFVEGILATGTLRTLAVPLSAVRTDKPQPYVQMLVQNQVKHQNIQASVRGDADGKTWVSVTGLPEGAMILDGSIGTLSQGTQVKIAAATQGKS